MNTKRLFSAGLFCILFVMAAFAFAGCQEVAPGTKTTVAPEDQKSALTTGQVNIGQSQQSAPEVIHTKADMEAFNAAFQGKDVKLCDKVADESYKKECAAVTGDQLFLEEAMAKGDKAICEKIVSADGRAECALEVDIKVRQDKSRLETQQEIKKTEDLANQIIAARDVKRCKELGPDHLFACEMNIVYNEAVKNADPKICEKASQASTVELCKTRYAEYKESVSGI